MKTTLLLFISLFAISTLDSVKAQERQASDYFSLGYRLNSYGGNFGFGLDLIPKRNLIGRTTLHLTYDYQFLDHLDGTGYETWSPYSSLRLGILSSGAQLSPQLRLYGEGGTLMVFPGGLSTASVFVGGYGLFGLEMYHNSRFGFFFELGANGVDATANLKSGRPIIASGFMISSGFRFHFK